MSRPVIGICAALELARWAVWEQDAFLTPRSYVEAVARAGGMALLLPPDPLQVEEPDEVLDLIDGLMLAGGVDIDPAVYGAERHPTTQMTIRERDAFELALTTRAIERDMPVLGICRGMQLLNVARGGDLVQHLEGDTHKGPPGTYTRHAVTVLPGTHLAGVLGTDAHTHSCHHQAPDRLGDGLRVAATAEDGTVEAIEDPAARYVVGVLWHPEEDEEGGAALFEALVGQATTYRRAAA